MPFACLLVDECLGPDSCGVSPTLGGITVLFCRQVFPCPPSLAARRWPQTGAR